MSTPLIIGGIVLGVAILTGVTMFGKKREETEDTGFGVENPVQNQYEGGKRSRRRKSCSRRSRRVKI